MPERWNVVGPKSFLSVVGAKLSLSRNFAHHSGFRVCVRRPRGAFPVALGTTVLAKPTASTPRCNQQWRACPSSCCTKGTLTGRLHWGLEHCFLALVFLTRPPSPSASGARKMKPRFPKDAGASPCRAASASARARSKSTMQATVRSRYSSPKRPCSGHRRLVSHRRRWPRESIT